MRYTNSKNLYYCFLLALILGLNSCAPPVKYKPEVRLGVQEYLFSKKFKFESFNDLRPASDTILEKGLFKFKMEAPSKYNYKGNLSMDLKTSISDGFKSTKFVDISEDDNFDFKIVGEVSHFYLKEAMTRFFLFSLPLTPYFAFFNFFLPAFKEDANIQIKFNVLTNKNVLLGTYSGKYIKKRKYSAVGKMLKNSEYEYGYSERQGILNFYFSEAVMDIQSQMIADSLKYR
jgi:hypothetical protein